MKRLDGIYRRRPSATIKFYSLKVPPKIRLTEDQAHYGSQEPTTLPNLYETINYLDKAIEQHRG